ADYLAICNSSYSRMAAILAEPTQKCFIPSFAMQCFVPYEPWMDPAFWARFADTGVLSQSRVETQSELELSARGNTVWKKAQETEAVVLDVSDLLLHLLHHPTISGIQRGQIEILLNLESACSSMSVYFAVLSRQGGLFTIDKGDLLKALQDLGSGTVSR